MLALQGVHKINNIDEVLETNIEYTKCMILIESGILTSEKLDEIATKIAKYRSAAKKKMQEHNAEYNKKKEKLRNELPKTRTVYSVFHTLADLAEYCSKPGNKALLFLDEINRCSNEVMQETMNIILNRTINGYDLPNNCYVVAAANPSSSFIDFKDSEYQVNEFDHAQLSRLSVIPVETDERNWLTWASSEGKNERPNIEDEITEFIASQPELLLVTKGTDDILPNPR